MTTLQQQYDAAELELQELHEEHAIYMEWRSNYEVTRKEFRQWSDEVYSPRVQELIALMSDLADQINEELFVQDVEQVFNDYNPCEPSSYDIEAQTVEVEAVESDDDWLLEEWNAICDDPAGERFQRPQPVFQSFMHYVMFVLGILGKTVSNYLSWNGYGINTNTVIA